MIKERLDVEKIALDYLETYSEEYKDNIDPLMIPFKNLFSENGYITLHSCSGHVKFVKYKDRFGFSKGSKDNHWYLFFAAIKPMSNILKVVKTIAEKYGYYIRVEEAKFHAVVKEGWVLRYDINFNYTYDELYEINKNIYKEFEKEFNKIKQKKALV